MEESRKGSPSILVNPEVHAVFDEDVPGLHGKNVDALFKYEYATGPEKAPKYNIIPWADSKNSLTPVGESTNIYVSIKKKLKNKSVNLKNVTNFFSIC